MVRRIAFPLLSAALLAAVATSASPKPAPLSYKDHVAPIFKKYCNQCHSGPNPADRVDTSTPKGLRKVVRAGNPDRSEIWRHMNGGNPPMPPKDYPQPSADAKNRIKRWIAEGAKFDN